MSVHRYGDLPTVRVIEVTPAHVISYDPDRDILPMVLANCSYSVAVAEGTQLDYDFVSFQNELHGRFIRGKSTIARDEVMS
jgi:hypothetical protein